MISENEVRLRGLLERLSRARAAQKNPRAETLIREALERQPDAAYLLAHRVLVLEAALEESREQMARVQSASLAPPVGGAGGNPGLGGRLKHAAAAGVAAGVFLFQGVDVPGGDLRLGGGLGTGSETVMELTLDGELTRSVNRGRHSAGEALVYFDGYQIADDEGIDLA
jgi:hypothetical protein